jgi:hypothetical protein
MEIIPGRWYTVAGRGPMQAKSVDGYTVPMRDLNGYTYYAGRGQISREETLESMKEWLESHEQAAPGHLGIMEDVWALRRIIRWWGVENPPFDASDYFEEALQLAKTAANGTDAAMMIGDVLLSAEFNKEKGKIKFLAFDTDTETRKHRWIPVDKTNPRGFDNTFGLIVANVLQFAIKAANKDAS